MFWNPSVNLLVRIRVGGVSFVGIVFMNEGIVPPLSLFHMKRRKKEKITTQELFQQILVACYDKALCRATWGSTDHHPPGGSSIAGVTGGTEGGSWGGEAGYAWGLRSYRRKNPARLSGGKWAVMSKTKINQNVAILTFWFILPYISFLLGNTVAVSKFLLNIFRR